MIKPSDVGLDRLQLKRREGIFFQQGHHCNGLYCNGVEKTDHELCGLMISFEKHKACIRSKIL